MARRCRRSRIALLALACGALLFAGCVEEAPARSVPLETIAPLPPPMAVDQALVVGYDLERIDVSARFWGAWDEDTARTLAELGYRRLPDDTLAFERADGSCVAIEPEPASFWFNATYVGFDVYAVSMADAQRLADDAWKEREPSFLGTVGVLEQRGAHPLAEPPLRTNAFAARLSTPL